MKALKIVGAALAVYVGIVALFESSLGYFQPEPPGSLTITTTDEDGNTHDRVLTELASGGKVYVAVNHWPRAWYRRTLVNPNVQALAGPGGAGAHTDAGQGSRAVRDRQPRGSGGPDA